MNKHNSTYQDVSWMFPPRTGAVGTSLPTTPTIDTRLLLEKSHRIPQQEQIKTLMLSAAIIGGCITVLSLVVSAGIFYLVRGRVHFVWMLFPLSLLLGVTVSAILSAKWVYKGATRHWQLEDIDRSYRLRDVDDLYALRHNLPDTPVRDLVRVELHQPLDGGRQIELIDLPADSERLALLARGLLEGTTLSEAQWTGARGLFTRSEFSQLRAELIRRKLAAWNNPGTPARGCQLTAPGRAIFRRLAGETTPPAPTEDVD